jgi:hypothetical protein
MGTTAIFIDAAYLDKVLYYDHNKKRVDYMKLTQELTAGNQLFRAYYYHCLPYQSNPPTEEEKRRYGKMHGFIHKAYASFRSAPWADCSFGHNCGG